MTAVVVHKLSHTGAPLWHYAAALSAYSLTMCCVQAVFERPDVQTAYVTFAKGDVMIEWFYTDRWYNVFRLEAGDTGVVKGWYCNITRPARFGPDPDGLGWRIEHEDLALDVFVFPSGRVVVLDEAEFNALGLSAAEQAQCWAAVDELKRLAAEKAEWFGQP
jgi:uncharacterized protein